MLYRHIGMCVSCMHALLYDWQQLECVVKHVAVVFLDIQQSAQSESHGSPFYYHMIKYNIGTY